MSNIQLVNFIVVCMHWADACTQSDLQCVLGIHLISIGSHDLLRQVLVTSVFSHVLVGVRGGGVGECDGGCSSQPISLSSPTGCERGICLLMLFLLGLRGRFGPAGFTRSLRVSEDSSIYAKFSPKKSSREGWVGEQAGTTRTETSCTLPGDPWEPSSPDSSSSEFREFEYDSDQDPDGVSDPETEPDADSDPDPDSDGDPETAPGGVFSSNRETDLDPASSANLDEGLTSYLPSDLDLVSDVGVYLGSGQATSRCPFSRMASASRDIPCTDPTGFGRGWR